MSNENLNIEALSSEQLVQQPIEENMLSKNEVLFGFGSSNVKGYTNNKAVDLEYAETHAFVHDLLDHTYLFDVDGAAGFFDFVDVAEEVGTE